MLHIGVEGPRVLLEVVETIELSRIHEDARDHMITLVARVLHERDVTGMQSAHGRNETDRP